ncbi:MAG TPA: zinc-ribbon domain-containing protein [Ktedonobacteraceae bacterium]|nr:zinc-ribbon domain-containing protein [Ktedonobacteraceae bacterium]
MSQMPPRFCPQCGTSVPAGQRFCSNCGATMDADFGKPTSASSDPNRSSFPDIPTQLAAGSMPSQGESVPPPPPIQSYTPPSGSPQSYTNYPTEAAQSYGQSAPAIQPTPVPTYAKPQKDSSKRVLGQIGCGVMLIILLIVAICGVSGFFAYRWVSGLANSVPTVTSGNGNSVTGNGNGVPGNSVTPTIVPASQQMNVTVPYASEVISISNVQEASSFTDDANSNSPVLLRVNMSEHNTYAGSVYPSYSDNFRLILPDGTSVAPTNEQNSGGLAQAVNRQNWIDFPLTSKVDISKLTLQIGGPTEAQMSIPLTGNANVSKYQDRTITPNSSFQYAGLNWTLTSATSSLSADGKQATTSMRYVTLTFKVDNPTSSGFYTAPSDNMRLQEGSSVNPSTNWVFNTIPPGTTGNNVTATFLVPQNGSSLTLIMLAQPNTNPPVTQVTQTIQL